MKNKGIRNIIELTVFSLLIGAFVGAILWTFLKIMSIGMGFVWEWVPEQIGGSGVLYTIAVCTVGGLIIGLFRKKYGDYPEELDDVMARVKTEKHYQYDKMLVMLIAALLPLLMGASIGPEAGLTGIIIGLCYWAGDNLKFAGVNAKAYTEVGTAVTLSVLFGSPLFGIFAVEEDETDVNSIANLTKGSKIFLYGLAMAGGMGAYAGLTSLFGAGLAGFPSFDEVEVGKVDYAMAVVYVIAGLVLAWFYEITHEGMHSFAGRMKPVFNEAFAGLCLGTMGAFVPMIMFSGEEEMHELMHTFEEYGAVVLIIVAFLKVFLTNVCIQLGLKGGHFFPVIFAGVALGFGIAIAVFGVEAGMHVAFAAEIVTATMLGGIMKKPLAVTMLLILCFPVDMFIWCFVAAVIGSKVFTKVGE